MKVGASCFSTKLFKLDHQHPVPSSSPTRTALCTFESELSKQLTQLCSFQPKLSFTWIHRALNLLISINQNLATLIAEISYPITNWGFESKQEYIDHTLYLLQHLNSLSSSIAHLKQQHLQLLHALNLLNTSPSRAKGLLKLMDCMAPETREDVGFPVPENGCSSENEWVIRRALLDVKWVSYWVFEIILSNLGGEAKMIKTSGGGGGFRWWTDFMRLQSEVCEEIGKKKGMEKGVMLLEEGSAVNNGVIELLEALREGEGEKMAEVGVELRKRIEEVGGWLDGIKELIDKFFGGVLRVRNELLDGVTLP